MLSRERSKRESEEESLLSLLDWAEF